MGDKSVERTAKIMSNRRKNNIYGEVDDILLNHLLKMGLDAAFHNIDETTAVHIIGRSQNALYIIYVFKQTTSKEVPKLDDETKDQLIAIGNLLSAIPIYIVHRHYCQKTKAYNIDGTKLDIV